MTGIGFLRSLVMLTYALVMMTAFAYGDGCMANEFNVVAAGGPCTIGDLTFDFSSYSAFGEWDSLNRYSVPPTPPIFTPITGSNPGFMLSLAPLVDCPTCEDPQGFGSLSVDYTVSSTDEYLTGYKITVQAAISITPFEGPLGTGEDTFGAPGCNLAGAGAFMESRCRGAIVTAFAPVRSISGSASFSGEANCCGGGALNYVSVSGSPGNNDNITSQITFSEEAVVPEPAYVFVLGTMLVLFPILKSVAQTLEK